MNMVSPDMEYHRHENWRMPITMILSKQAVFLHCEVHKKATSLGFSSTVPSWCHGAALTSTVLDLSSHIGFYPIGPEVLDTIICFLACTTNEH